MYAFVKVVFAVFVLMLRGRALFGDVLSYTVLPGYSPTTFNVLFKSTVLIESVYLSGTKSNFFMLHCEFENCSDFDTAIKPNGLPKIFGSTNYGFKTHIDFPFFARSIKLKLARAYDFYSRDIRATFFGYQFMEENCICFTEEESDCRPVFARNESEVSTLVQNITFFVKVAGSNGVVFTLISLDGDVFVLYLYHGILHLSGTDPSVIQKTGFVLDDNRWHRVDLSFERSNIKLYSDGLLYEKRSGVHKSLLYVEKVFVGCAPAHSLPHSLDTIENFSGFLYNFGFNGLGFRTNHTSLKNKRCEERIAIRKNSTIGILRQHGSFYYPIKINQDSPISAFRLKIDLEFRTFVTNARLLLLQNNVNAFDRKTEDSRDLFISRIELRIDVNGSLILRIATKENDLFDVPSVATINDDGWHHVTLVLAHKEISYTIDDSSDDSHQFTAGFKLDAFNVVRFGGDAFIGCFRSLFINNKPLDQSLIAPDETSALNFGSCAYRDWCLSNPCLNRAKCLRKLDDFECLCLQGYAGKTCQISVLPTSCEHYFRLKKTHSTNGYSLNHSVALHVPGFEPLNVRCVSDKDTVWTIIEHNHMHNQPIKIEGFDKPGQAHVTFDYFSGNRDKNSKISLLNIIRSHAYCRQEMKFECIGGVRLRSDKIDDDTSFSYWMPFSLPIYFRSWGLPSTSLALCPCALNGSCRLNTSLCNCDGSFEKASDFGSITTKEFLPIRRLFIGDTSFNGKTALISVGAVYCKDNVHEMPIIHTNPPGFLTILDRRNQLDSVFDHMLDIQFEFMTSISDGKFTLLSNFHANPRDLLGLDQDFLLIYGQDSEIHVEVLIGRSLITIDYDLRAIDSRSKKFCDNNWHTVHFNLNYFEVSLSIDDDLKNAVITSDRRPYLMPNLTDTWRLGASVQAGSVFLGAFRRFFLNNLPHDLNSIANENQTCAAGIIASGLNKQHPTTKSENYGFKDTLVSDILLHDLKKPFVNRLCGRDDDDSNELSTLSSEKHRCSINNYDPESMVRFESRLGQNYPTIIVGASVLLISVLFLACLVCRCVYNKKSSGRYKTYESEQNDHRIVDEMYRVQDYSSQLLLQRDETHFHSEDLIDDSDFDQNRNADKTVLSPRRRRETYL